MLGSNQEHRHRFTSSIHVIFLRNQKFHILTVFHKFNDFDFWFSNQIIEKVQQNNISAQINEFSV